MSEQMLWDIATARNDHPVTSFRAADYMNEPGRLTRCENYALTAIRRWPGRTAKELEKLNRDENGVIHRRIKGLVSKGAVRREYEEGCREAKLWSVE